MSMKYIDHLYEFMRPKDRTSAVEKIILYEGLSTLIFLALHTKISTYLSAVEFKVLLSLHYFVFGIVALFLFINLFFLYENANAGLRAFKTLLMTILVQLNLLFLLLVLPATKTYRDGLDLPLGVKSHKRRALTALVYVLIVTLFIFKLLGLPK